MKRKPVSSSNLASVGYDSTSQTLEVEFLNGKIYQYSGVPLSVYSSLTAASSHGSYLNQHVKRANYPYRKVN